MKFLFLALLFTLSLTLVGPVSAQYQVSQPPAARIMIEKKVFDPGEKGGTGTFVDNLSLNQFTFLPGQEVLFKLEIKNTGDKELKDVQVKDKLPQELDFVSGGDFDKNSNTISFKISSLGANQLKTFEVKAKFKSEKDLVSNTTCVTNLAEVRAEGMVNQDTASVCVSKQILGEVSVLPKTGPIHTSALLLTSILSSGAAIYLAKRRKT